ncbi:MAG: hypothetical protein PUB51_06955, partial [Oscillospiraceae bacterium]|nr:hypothetical protein [Oscillospiraceae bacterium]
MLAIQGQQQLLRHLYSQWGVDKERDRADFADIIKCVEEGDVPAVCDLIAVSADRMEAAVIAGLRSQRLQA